MKIAGDTHTHTLICQHAYSTLLENIRAAAALGQRFLAFTEHCPAMKGAPPRVFFENIRKAVPREVEGVVVIRGCEANLLDASGTLDLPADTLGRLDMVIASMHPSTFLAGQPGTREDRTAAWLEVARNPLVDIVGHPGNPKFDFDYRTVLQALRDGGKAVELNASSRVSRPGCEANCLEIASLCREFGVPVVLSSDAHFCTAVGHVEWSVQLAEKAGIPEEQILNSSYRRFRDWLCSRRQILDLPEE
jgi:putative hydrolase